MSMTKLFSRSIVLALSIALPTQHSLGAACDAICSLNSGNAASMISDPKCKNDPNCISCVVNAAKNSQAGAQCAGYSLATTAKKGETINATLNTAATVLCGIGCVVSNTPALAASAPAWNKACGYSGLAVTASEVGYTVKEMINSKKMDLAGIAGAGVKTAGAVTVIKNATKAAVGNANSMACLNAVVFGVAAAAKIASISKMKKAADNTCRNAEGVSNSASAIAMSCLSPEIPPEVRGGSGQGLFTATPQNFIPTTVSDVDRLASTGAVEPYLRQMKPDFQRAENEGKLDLAAISKRIDAGEDASSILADSGVPSGILSAIKDEEGKIKAGEKSDLLAALDKKSGGYTQSAGVASTGAGGANGEMNSEIGFGSDGATPAEGAETLGFDRKPAADGVALLGSDGDVFHAGFSGSIFDIVTIRIKEAKGTYAELEPAGRMNRVFNGLSDPKRKPATSASAKKN